MTTRDEEKAGAARTTGGRTAIGEVFVEATPERVWKALTEAAELERWFPLEAAVEPGVGGTMRLSWQNEFVGESEILAWDPPRHLRTAWAFHDDDRVAPQVTDYHVSAEGGGTRVRVVTSGFPDDPSWDGWVEGTVRGWRFELRSLKHYLEHYPGTDRSVVYLRRRVSVAPDEAWARLFPGGAPALPGAAGEPFDDEPGRQFAAVTATPAGGLLRVSLEPTGVGAETRDVTVWLSTWDADPDVVSRLEGGWRAALADVFPEGEDPDGRS